MDHPYTAHLEESLLVWSLETNAGTAGALLSPLCPAQASPRTTPAEAKPEITFLFARLKVYKMVFDMFANKFNSPWQGKPFYKPFPLPKSWMEDQIRWALARKKIFIKGPDNPT